MAWMRHDTSGTAAARNGNWFANARYRGARAATDSSYGAGADHGAVDTAGAAGNAGASDASVSTAGIATSNDTSITRGAAASNADIAPRTQLFPPEPKFALDLSF